MKKRILSLLLVAMMVIPMFVMPTSVSAADEEWYSYEFEETDIRNITDGQVIDVALKGEVANEPVMDGVLSKGEYTNVTTMPRLSGTSANASLPVYVAVKGEYLYIAFKYEGESARQTIQYDIGVMGTHTSEQAWNRINGRVGRDGTIGGGGTSFGLPSLSGYVAGSCAIDGRNLIKAAGWTTGVYEVKIDIGYAYRVFAGGPTHEGIWESPTVSFMFWYDVDSKGTVGQTQYAHVIPSAKIDSARTVNWVPKTVIIPETARDLIDDYKGVIGKLGYDHRYAVESQTVFLNSEATTVPTADGVISSGEYQGTIVHEQDWNTAFGNITGYYSVKDGYVYAAFQYADASARNCIVQYGLFGSNGSIGISRIGATIKPDGSCVIQGDLFKNAADPNNWMSIILGAKGNKGPAHAISATAFSHKDGITTLEMRVSIAILAVPLEEAGWDAENTNAVYFMLFPDSSKNIGKNVNITGASGQSIITQIQKETGIAYHAGYVCPTVVLPTGYAEEYIVTDVDDFEAFGQKHLHASASTVTLDGKIGAGEYTTSETYTGLRTADSKAQPDLTENVNGTNYFTYDAEYVYVGATVYEPNFVAKKTGYQFNISVLNKKDGKVDMGDGVKRISAHIIPAAEFESGVKGFGGVCRSQKVDNAYPDEARFTAAFKAASGAEYVAAYDAATKTMTYELKIKIADLKSIFNVDEVESFNFLNYVTYGDGKLGWNLYKTNDEGGAYKAIVAQTHRYNAGVVNYSNDFFGHVVHLDGVAQTRDGASVRISNTVSGLRFKSHYTNEYLADMSAYAAAKGEEMEIGTLIAPKDYITGEFTHAALGAGRYVEVKADLNTPFANANGVTTIAGSLVNIKEANLGRDFAGRGYIKIGNEYFYTDTYSVKNVSSIASAALLDVQATSGNGYVHPVEGGYSPYSAGQRTILNSLIAK